MKRLMLIGQSFSGKTTLLQKLKGSPLHYQKTQSLQCSDVSIDTPGEYLENRRLNSALITTSYEADVIGLVHSATSAQVFSPMFASVFTKLVIGIITKMDHDDADIERAQAHLTLAGATSISITSSFSGESISSLIHYLNLESPGIKLDIDKNKAQMTCFLHRKVRSPSQLFLQMKK